jgi:Ca2+-binding RTX toxin-like protein
LETQMATIPGTSSSESLTGTTSADTFFGGGGDDTMFGLAGDDTYYIEGNADVIFEAADAGIDTVVISGARFSDYTMEANVKNATVVSGVVNFEDNSLDNTIDGGVANGHSRDIFIWTQVGGDNTIFNANFIFSGAGNDALIGSLNSSQLYAGAGNDTITGGDVEGLAFGGGPQIYGGILGPVDIHLDAMRAATRFQFAA